MGIGNDKKMACSSRRKAPSFNQGSMRPPPLPNASVTQLSQQLAPPSSIAAIVSNFQKDGEGESNAFNQLLAEVMGPDFSSSGDVDTATHYKLLQIITGAGLTVLLSDDPFAQVDSQLRSASISLVVMKLTIERTPEVLFMPPPPDASQPEHALMYIWLFSQLFPLLGHPKTRTKLVGELLAAMEAMFFAAASLPRAWKHLKTMTAYCRACLNCIVPAFQSTATVKDTLSNSFRLELPTDFTVEASVRAGCPSYDPRSAQFRVLDGEHAALIGIYIFSLLSRVGASQKNIPVIRSITDNLASAQHSLSKMWSTLHLWESFPMLNDKASVIRVGILEALSTTLDNLALSKHNPKLDGLYFFAVRCVVDTINRPIAQMDHHAEHAMTGILMSLMSIYRHSPLIQELLKDRLYPSAFALISDGSRSHLLRQDTQVALLKLVAHISQITGEQRHLATVNARLKELTDGNWNCKDENLNKRLEAVLWEESVESPMYDFEGPRKRLRLDNPDDIKQSLIKKVYSLLGSQEAMDIAGLSRVAAEGFKQLSEEDRCTAVHSLGLLVCAEAGDLRGSRVRYGHVYKCSYCDSDAPILKLTRNYADAHDAELLGTMEAIHKMEKFTESPKIRALGLETLRRMINHTRDLTHLNLDNSQLGMWCLNLLQSGRRELRIAAGRAIPSYVSFAHDQQVLNRNRFILMDSLKMLSEGDDTVVQETCVLAWGQFGRISCDSELNIVLLRLIDYLGHPNEMVIGVAWNELDALVHAHETTPRKLTSPFWRSISVAAVKQLQSKPQILQGLLQFISMDQGEFLRLTQGFTLPYLVLSRKTEIIYKVAQASRPDCSVQVICHENIAAILAVMLVQNVDNVEKYTMGVLETISPEFSSSSLEELVRPDSLVIAGDLLKSAGDVDENDKEQKQKIYNALRIVSRLSYRPLDNQPKPKKAKKIDYLANFFETHVLGLCTLFSDTLKNAQGKTTDLEKIRCLKAIQEMLILAGGSISSALPQLCACSQSALESDSLRTTALKTWAVLVANLPDEDLVPMLSQTFSIILRYWSDFDVAAANIAQEMVSCMLEKRPVILKESIAFIPSMASIPVFAKIESRLVDWRSEVSPQKRLHQLALRCGHENVIVVEYALVELRECIKQNQSLIHTSAGHEKPDPVVPELIRCLLDVIITFKDPDLKARPRIARLSAECLGLIGAVNPNTVESSRVKQEMAVLHNFSRADESADFALFFLEKVLVKQFLAATDTKSQGFLAWCAQELLRFCTVNNQIIPSSRRTESVVKTPAQARWDKLQPAAQEALLPFLKSKYSLSGKVIRATFSYPLFKYGITYREWLISIITELLCRPVGHNAEQIFNACVRICRGQDVSISKFLFPHAVLHIAVGGREEDRQNIITEFLAVLRYNSQPSDPPAMKETLRQCTETIFSVVDHMAKWLRDKSEDDLRQRTQQARQQNRHYDVEEEDGSMDPAVPRVKRMLEAIPPDLMAYRSLEFHSYARALLCWEQHIRHRRVEKNNNSESDLEPLYEQLQHIYTHVDEPDGMAGISAKIPTLEIDQQILEHRKAGKWTAAQSWYELLLADNPGDVETQVNLIGCLRDSGQHDALLKHVDGMLPQSPESHNRLLPYAVEASWVAGRWDALEKYLSSSNERTDLTYDIRVGCALSELRKQNMEEFMRRIDSAREGIAGMMTESATGSIRQCHPFLVQLHALSELQGISEELHQPQFDKSRLIQKYENRLNLMGTYSKDKRYVLAIRRAAFQLSGKANVMKDETMSAWLATAKLARKDDNTQQAYNAVHHATMLNPPLATIEYAKLLWREGQHKSAIRNLDGAIEKKILQIGTEAPNTSSSVVTNDTAQPPQNLRVAKAILLLARWLEDSGQTHSQALLSKYSEASRWFSRWEQGFYYLGRHYNKLYEAERNMHPSKQSQVYLNGESAKLIVQNYLRALAFGVKYIFQTLPRLLTVWLDLGEECCKPLDITLGTEEFRNHIHSQRIKALRGIHASSTKYSTRLGAWMFFTAFPQIISRIIHKHEQVSLQLQGIILRVVLEYPREAMWSLQAVIKSTDKERSTRGQRVLLQFKEQAPRGRKSNSGVDYLLLIAEAKKLTDELLSLGNHEITNRVAHLSLSKHIGFRHHVAPCQLVLPAQAVLTATLPSHTGALRNHKSHQPFPGNQPTIARFHDEIDVMSSLQKPRKIKIEGSDGRTYTFLCKPKDDLRKDARLMEFDNTINRFFKRDPESSQRSLYIRTYAVTALNEECGLIEWVNKMRPLRDIILRYYKQRGVPVNYNAVRVVLDEACSHPTKTRLFTEDILNSFPSVFHEWFLEMFSEPAAWFDARLRYTRTSAVMSMVGTVLGLGDRHGENILFDQSNGDTLHVDFNCLFNKGLSFDKPERVPFRLTHNMVDAFGVTGYEGVFRKACESAMRLLRHNEETFMTVLEPFIHDPAVDMVGKKGKKGNAKVPDTPQAVLEGIQNKLRGLWEGDTVPLSVEGFVEVLIKTAVSHENLCAMYIGWCPMF